MCRTLQLVYQLQMTSGLLAFSHGILELCNAKRNLISQSLREQRWHSSSAVALRLLVDLVWVMLIKTVCSSKGWRTNQECVPLPSFCHSTWTLKRSFSDRFPVHAFTLLSCSSFAGRPRNILLHWSHGLSRAVINSQKSHHMLPAVHCDCLIVSRLSQMKLKHMRFQI